MNHDKTNFYIKIVFNVLTLSERTKLEATFALRPLFWFNQIKISILNRMMFKGTTPLR